nr:hypothetical protein [Tanacetum cinerariifolium]
MSTSNKKTLAESGSSDRPPILEKRNYVPWESWFLRFLGKQERGMRADVTSSPIDKGPYARKIIPDLDNTTKNIPEPINKKTDINKS